MFVLAQVLGIIALGTLAISFQKNDKKVLLKYQVFASMFFALQYLCLNAITGFLMNIITIIRNLIFRKYNEKVPKIYLILLIIAILVIISISYNGPISLLPAISVILYSVAVWQNNMKVTRFLEVISSILFIIYNMNVLAISGIVSSIIELLSTLIAIYRFDIKKTNKYNNE